MGHGEHPSIRGMLLLGSLVALVATISVVVTGPMAGLALVVGAFALACVIHRPGILFAAYLLIPFYKGGLQGYSPVDITLVLGLLNAVQIIPVIVDRRRRDISRVGILLWVALALLVLGGVVYAPDQGLAIGRAATYWALVLLPILPAAYRVGSEARHIRDFLWTFLGMGILTVVLGLTQLSSGERLVVLGTNTILVSRAALLVPLVGVTFAIRAGVPLVRAVTVILIPAAVVVALATGSRGPLLAIAALAGLGAIRYLARPRTPNWRLAGGIVGLAVATAVVLSIAAPDLPLSSIERFASFGNFVQGGLAGATGNSAGETSSAERVRLYSLAISLFEQRPFLGVGTAGFESLSPRFLGPIDGLPYPHNAVLQIAAEFGLVGVAIFAGLVLLALTRRLPRGTLSRAVGALFLFFLLNAMVSGDIFSDRTTWGLLMLLLLADTSRAGEGWGSTDSIPVSDAPPSTDLVLNADRGPQRK